MGILNAAVPLVLTESGSPETKDWSWLKASKFRFRLFFIPPGINNPPGALGFVEVCVRINAWNYDVFNDAFYADYKTVSVFPEAAVV